VSARVPGYRGPEVPVEVWEQHEMRTALASREISAVYRLLRKHGVSQRQIAAMTGQSQSEVSEILRGRQVTAYDLLRDIADGLGVPRGYMGLAYDEATAIRVVSPFDDEQVEDDERVRREFLAHAAEVTMGAAVNGPEQFPDDEGILEKPQVGLSGVSSAPAPRRPVAQASKQAIGWVSRVLPTVDRERYLEECLGELDDLAQSRHPLRVQLSYVLGLASRVLALRFALRGSDAETWEQAG